MEPIQLFTFSGAWGLPTTGPFGLKLMACLRMLGVPYEAHFENNVGKGPKRKSPWIVEGGRKIGDTEIILERIERTLKKTLDGELSPDERARSMVLRRMVEEHYHQVFEYELVVLDAGFAHLRKLFATQMPGPLLAVLAPMIRRSFKKHLFERGIARHTAAEVEKMGRDDVDALSAWLGDRAWFISDHPTKADASAFGLLAVSIKSGMETPVCTYARTKPNLVAFVDRMLATVFAEGGTASKLAA
jgi:glutathione S-transferase